MKLLQTAAIAVGAIVCVSTPRVQAQSCDPITALPSTLGLDKCVGNNLQKLLDIVKEGLDECSLIELIKLPNNPAVDKITTIVNDMLEKPDQISAIFYDHMKATAGDEMEDFCQDINSLLSPCLGSFVGPMIKVINEDLNCCSELSDIVDMLNLVVPPDVSKESFILDEVVNGFNNFLCSTIGDDRCGAYIYDQLLDVYTRENFRVLESFLLPMVTVSEGDECDASNGKQYINSATLEVTSTIEYSCCIDHVRPLFESIYNAFYNVLGNTPDEFLNGAFELKKENGKFRHVLPGTKDCNHKDTCSNPKALIKDITRKRKPGTNDSGKNSISGLECKWVDICNDEDVCTKVCETGSATLDDWAAQTLAYERKLTNRQPLCYAMIPATHNTVISLAYGFGLRDLAMNANMDSKKKPYAFMKTNNNVLSVSDQLNIGVRWLEIDIHHFLGELRSAHCGGFGSNSIQIIFDVIKEQLSYYGNFIWSPNLLGCFPSLSGIAADKQPKSKEVMDEIKSWLDDHPDELVFVYLDNGGEINELDKWNDVHSLVQETFGDLLMPHEDVKTLESSGWNSASIQDLIDDGYRVVLLANRDTGVAYNMRSFCGGHQVLDTEYIDETLDEERSINGIEFYTGEYMIRSYQSVLRYIALGEGGTLEQTLPTTFNRNNTPNFVRWNMNLIATDMVDGSIMKGMIWSWDEDQPSVDGSNATVVVNSNGRWSTPSNASQVLHKGCWSSSNLAWEIIETSKACSSGYEDVGPVDPYQNYLLQEQMQTQSITGPVQINVDVAFE